MKTSSLLGLAVGLSLGLALSEPAYPANVGINPLSMQMAHAATAEPFEPGPYPSTEPPRSWLCIHSNFEVLSLPWKGLQTICRKLFEVNGQLAQWPAQGVGGCSRVGDGSGMDESVIAILEGTPYNSTLFRHELAHICGWNHEGPR